MADNARFHNKLHRKNHHSIQTPGYPDSATDPIASTEEPFEGDMVVNATVSAQNLWINTDAYVGRNTTIMGNLCVYGDDSYFETYTTVTSSMSVINHGSGPALTVKQTGAEPIARFLDGDAIGSENALLIADTGQIVINADRPTLDRRVTISGSITASGNTEFQGGSATSFRTFAANDAAANNWDAAGFNTGHADGMRSFAVNYNTLAAASGSFAQGEVTRALGNFSHSEGSSTYASGSGSHSEGHVTQAKAAFSHTEGGFTRAEGVYAHTEGEMTSAYGIASHTEGSEVISVGRGSHAEGFKTSSIGTYSHTEGQSTSALGGFSHAEGLSSLAVWNGSHAEGYASIAYGRYSHAEGKVTYALGVNSHTEGALTTAFGDQSHAEGESTVAYASGSHAEGYMTVVSGQYAHAEGYMTTASGFASHTEGLLTSGFGAYSHSEGEQTLALSGAHAEGKLSKAIGAYSHAEGVGSQSLSVASHAEGVATIASGRNSHAEGYITIADGDFSHSEGYLTQALGLHSHAEGSETIADGDFSHSSGIGSRAKGSGSYTTGVYTSATGIASYAAGQFTVAEGLASYALGFLSRASENSSYVWSSSSFNPNQAYVESTRMGQYLVSAFGGVFIPGNVGIGTDSIDDKLNVRGNTNMFRLTAAASEFYTLTANRGLSAVSTSVNPHLFRGVVGVNTDLRPVTSFALHIKGGNIRVDGVDYSWLPGFNGAAGGYDTDGQSLFDLRSASPSANYNLSIASSGLNHFMKFFGGRDGDPNPFIVVKTNEPLRFASFNNFFNNPADFREHMRIDTQNSRVGIGTQAPGAKLTVNGSISSNNTSDARQILSAGVDLWTLGLGSGGGGGGNLTSDVTTDLAVGALTALSILRSGATLQHCMERLLTQVSFPTVSPFASGSMTALINSVTISNGGQVEVGEQTASFTAALNPGSWIGNLVGGIWNPSTFQINAAGAANNYLFFGNVDNLTNTLLTTAANINDGTNSYAINIGFNVGSQPINSKSVLQPAFGPGRAPGTMTITGRRKLFYSNDTSASAPADSSAVRGLTGVIGSGSTWPANGTTFNIPIYAGTKRIVIAYPTTFGVISEVRNGLGFNVTGDFTQTTVSVNGANSLFPTNYYVYTYLAVGTFASNETYSVIV
jgi:hypothetical protein